jgi:hypothetical protein
VDEETVSEFMLWTSRTLKARVGRTLKMEEWKWEPKRGTESTNGNATGEHDVIVPTEGKQEESYAGKVSARWT